MTRRNTTFRFSNNVCSLLSIIMTLLMGNTLNYTLHHCSHVNRRGGTHGMSIFLSGGSLALALILLGSCSSAVEEHHINDVVECCSMKRVKRPWSNLSTELQNGAVFKVLKKLIYKKKNHDSTFRTFAADDDASKRQHSLPLTIIISNQPTAPHSSSHGDHRQLGDINNE